MRPIIGAQAASPTRARHLSVDAESDGQRLDNYLLRELKGVPKTLIYRIIRSGEVRLNKGRASADARVGAGDDIRVPPLRVSESPLAAAPIPARTFTVLHEDETLLALDKPAGVAVHGGSGLSFGVIEQLRKSRPQERFLELVHRLDRETSGVLLVAKKRKALVALQDQLRERRMGKTYLALALGNWPASLKVIDAPLEKRVLSDGQRHVRLAAADAPAARRAVTLVSVSRAWPSWTLLEVTIKTGRTHQIRVHLAGQGHPIAGDDKYGDFAVNKTLATQGLKRMFLHAARLRFIHPNHGEAMDIASPLPNDLNAFLDRAQASPV